MGKNIHSVVRKLVPENSGAPPTSPSRWPRPGLRRQPRTGVPALQLPVQTKRTKKKRRHLRKTWTWSKETAVFGWSKFPLTLLTDGRKQRRIIRQGLLALPYLNRRYF